MLTWWLWSTDAMSYMSVSQSVGQEWWGQSLWLKSSTLVLLGTCVLVVLLTVWKCSHVNQMPFCSKDGRLLFVTPMDPLYLILPYLIKSGQEVRRKIRRYILSILWCFEISLSLFSCHLSALQGKFQPVDQVVMDEEFPACSKLLSCARLSASMQHIAEEKGTPSSQPTEDTTWWSPTPPCWFMVVSWLHSFRGGRPEVSSLQWRENCELVKEKGTVRFS